MKVVAIQAILLFCLVGLVACSSSNTYAPVVNAWQDPAAMKSRYRVQKDDTVYSIALAFDVDYRDLVAANHLTPPYRLKAGQTLSMNPVDNGKAASLVDEDQSVTTFPACDIKVKEQAFHEVKMPMQEKDLSVASHPASLPLQRPAFENKQAVKELILPELRLKSEDCTDQRKQSYCTEKRGILLDPLPERTVTLTQDKIIHQVNSGRWQWPARGNILKQFSLQDGGSKGIDIAGNAGDPIRAVAPGKVVYSGCGLRGYGNLVIIKHSDSYLSAYAYNKKLLVREGDVVKAGAEIAKMGQNNSGQVLLHFEIRHNGKPVNPLLYL